MMRALLLVLALSKVATAQKAYKRHSSQRAIGPFLDSFVLCVACWYHFICVTKCIEHDGSTLSPSPYDHALAHITSVSVTGRGGPSPEINRNCV